MINVIDNERREIKEVLEKSILKCVENGDIPNIKFNDIAVEIPREKGHGDFSSNIAMQIAKQAKKAPRQIAEILIGNIKIEDADIDRIECAGPGFINFYLKDKWIYDNLKTIQHEKEKYGRLNIGNGQRVMVEFVSANPTGPLHMGNARGGALGDCIASVLEAAGYDVTREFYVNDAGNQIEKFGISLEARYLQLILGEQAVEFPEDGYHGDDIIDHMKNYIAENGDNLLNVVSEDRQRLLVEYALPRNIKKIESVLKSYGVEFDVWFSEQSLYDSGELEETIRLLKEGDNILEKEGALWFKASVFGCEKDEVIIRNNGLPTYFALDIAYHRNKFQKRKFDRVINLLGADHYGHVARMKAAVETFGECSEKLEFVIFQLVGLYRNGEIARMSKRTGKSITLEDLIEEVGRDAARFFFNTKASGSHLDFDLDLAVRQSNDNPVFYVQYAHARICSMMKVLKVEGIDIPDPDDTDLTQLKKEEEINLIKKLAEFPEEIRICAQTLEPSRLTRYVLDTASLFHSFYNACRVKGEEEAIMKARIILVDCTRIVIRNVLNLLSIDAPERM